MKLMTGELRSKAMRATPARHEAARLMYLPNRKGTLKRDNDYRQKVHRRALQTIRGGIDTSEPWSVHFSRGEDLKKAQQKEDRLDYVEKCNRKLVDKMMMIMQGICGTMMSELSHPEFNPGTLNQRRRQRELGRIDRDNLALMHRIERASSSYNRTLIKPKHFQEPHMGLFPRSEHSVKSATTKSRRIRLDRRQKRARTSPLGTTCGRPGGVGVDIRGAASITSALTEPSGMLALGTQPENSTDLFAPGECWVEEEGGGASTASKVPVEGETSQGAEANPTDSTTSVGLSPKPPSFSCRAACDSRLERSSSSCRKGRRLVKPVDVKPGESVFLEGVNISGEYMVLNVRRATSGYGPDGTDGFRINAYCPSTLAGYSLGVPAKILRTFTSGSQTAVRHMFRSGLISKRRWELLVSHLKLREMPIYGSLQTDDISSKDRDIATRGSENTAVDCSPVEGLNTPEAETAGALETPPASPTNNHIQNQNVLGLVLTPPDDAAIISLQSVIRGVLTRYKYQALKIAAVRIQAAIRGWRDGVCRQRREAATKIAAVARGRRVRTRVRKDIAARGIQKTARVWLHNNLKVKNQAASRVQAIVRGRHVRRDLQKAQQEAVAHAEKLRRKRRPRLTPYTMPLSPSKTGPSNNTNKGGRPTPTSDIRSILRNTSRKRAPKLSGSESCSRAAGRGRAPRSPIGNTAANASQGSVGSASRGSDQGPRPPGAKDSARSSYRRPMTGWATGSLKPVSPVINSPPSRGRPENSSTAPVGEGIYAAHRRESALVTLDSGDDSMRVGIIGESVDGTAHATRTTLWDDERISPSFKSRAVVFLDDLKGGFFNQEVLLETCNHTDLSDKCERYFTKKEMDRIKGTSLGERTLEEELRALAPDGAAEKSSETCSAHDLYSLFARYLGLSNADMNRQYVEEARKEWTG